VQARQHQRTNSDDGSELEIQSFTLSNSQVSAFKSSMAPLHLPKAIAPSSHNSAQANDDKKARALALLALCRRLKTQYYAAFYQWRAKASNATVKFYVQRLEQASAMIDRMSRFSRHFISLNTLSSLVNKIK